MILSDLRSLCARLGEDANLAPASRSFVFSFLLVPTPRLRVSASNTLAGLRSGPQ